MPYLWGHNNKKTTMPRIVKRAAKAAAKAKKKIDKLQSDRMEYIFGERKRQPEDKGLRKLSIDRSLKKARRLKDKADSAYGGGLFGDPIKRAQRKAKRKMRKEQGALAFGPTRKTKRQQKRGLRQMRKQQGR